MRIYGRLFWWASREWTGLITVGTLTAVTALVALAQPWPLKLLADFGLSHKPIPHWLSSPLTVIGLGITPAVLIGVAALASLAVAALNAVLDAALAWQWTVLGQRLARRLSTAVFEELLQLPLCFFHRHRLGDILQRLSNDTWAVSKLVNGLLVTPVTKVFALVMMAAVAWRLDHELALYSAATAPLMAIATVAFAQPLRQRNRVTRDAQARLASFVQQTLSAMPLVQAFGAEKISSDCFSSLAAEAAQRTHKGLLLARSYALVTGLISVSGTAVIVYVGGRKALSGTMSVGTYLVFLAYLRNAQRTLESLLKLYGSFQPLRAGLERVFEIFETSGEIIDTPNAKSLPANPRPLPLEVRGVTFRYDSNRPVLRELCLQVAPGEAVAVIGRSGAGKSTLLSLIPRLAEPESGDVLVDGTDVRDLQLRSLRQNVSFLFQDPHLWRRTVAENIAYGCEEASRNDIIDAARWAKADGFISRLPSGYDSMIGERGATLSGGERQRIALARAFLKNAPILLLDEPTAACDAETEAELTAAFRALARHRTTLIVAHRLSTVGWVDRVVVLEDGHIVETGSPQQLLKQGGAFQRWHRLQMSGIREEASV